MKPSLHLYVSAILKMLGRPIVIWTISALWMRTFIIIYSIWRGLGGPVVLFLAALQGVPQEMYEAAEVDGAFSDDDTDIEYMYLLQMEQHGIEPTYAQLAAAWLTATPEMPPLRPDRQAPIVPEWYTLRPTLAPGLMPKTARANGPRQAPYRPGSC